MTPEHLTAAAEEWEMIKEVARNSGLGSFWPGPVDTFCNWLNRQGYSRAEKLAAWNHIVLIESLLDNPFGLKHNKLPNVQNPLS